MIQPIRIHTCDDDDVVLHISRHVSIERMNTDDRLSSVSIYLRTFVDDKNICPHVLVELASLI